MLASVVLASLSGARQKGMIGAGQQFDSSLYHAFGANAALVLDLNGSVVDGSGNGNTFTGTTLTNYTWTTGITGATNNAIYLNGDAYSGITVNNPLVGFPSTPSNNGNYSISVWVKPNTLPIAGNYQGLLTWGDNSYCTAADLFLNGSSVAFSQWYNDTTSSVTVTAGVWQQITVSESVGFASIYLNGKFYQTLDMSTNLGGSCTSARTKLAPTISSSPAYIGTDLAWRKYAGSIDNVRIYNQSLQVAEVERLYAMEAPAHGIALK